MNASLLVKEGEPKKFNLLIENVQDFQIKKDFMFAMRKAINTTQLFISYKRESFIKADFQTELDIRVCVTPYAQYKQNIFKSERNSLGFVTTFFVYHSAEWIANCLAFLESSAMINIFFFFLLTFVCFFLSGFAYSRCRGQTYNDISGTFRSLIAFVCIRIGC